MRQSRIRIGNVRSLLDARLWNLVTRYGLLDITFQPAGTTGFADLWFARNRLPAVKRRGAPFRSCVASFLQKQSEHEGDDGPLTRAGHLDAVR